MIKMTAIGNLGKDALVNDVNGKKVINFSVAHTEKWNDAGGSPKEKTLWIECAYWSEKTSISPYLLKGTQVYVEGTPDVRVYETNTGDKGASLQLRVTQVQLLGGNKTGQPAIANGAPAASTGSHATGGTPVTDDLPF